MRSLFFFCLFVACGTPSFAEELRLLTDTSYTWHLREAPQLPATDREELALRAVVAGTTVRQERLTAYCMGQKDSFDIVTVEEDPESATDDFYAVSSHLIRDGKIWSDTRIRYVAKPNVENELVSREIAKDYLLGRIGQTPVIFNGWVYVVNYEGKCILTVGAKDENTVHFTYRYSICK